MKTKLTLTKKEIEDAIRVYVQKRGYILSEVEFKIGTKTHGDQRDSWITTHLEGAHAEVELKKQKKKSQNNESSW